MLNRSFEKGYPANVNKLGGGSSGLFYVVYNIAFRRNRQPLFEQSILFLPVIYRRIPHYFCG